MKATVITILTIFYSCIWFACLFLVFGFFMPTPVRFCRTLFGKNVRKTRSHSPNPDKEVNEYLNGKRKYHEMSAEAQDIYDADYDG